MAEKLKIKIHTLETALGKARKYCAYQECSQQEVRDKLYELGLHKKEVEQGIALLIEEGFLNEQRFAVAFAGGKFRINHLGRVKIRMALRSKKVTEYCIREALKQIPENEYNRIIEAIIKKRMKQVKYTDTLKRNYSVAQYLVGRGFEPELVWKTLNIND